MIIVTHEPDIAQYAKRAIEFRDGKMKKDVAIQNPARSQPWKSCRRCLCSMKMTSRRLRTQRLPRRRTVTETG